MDSEQWIREQRSKGIISFTDTTFGSALGIPLISTKRRLAYLRKKKIIFTPHPNFNVVVPDENAQSGYVHPDLFIDQLMSHLNIGYYISTLSAAFYQGASHQKPMEFQVCAETQVHAKKIGDYPIKFITNSEVSIVPIEKYKTKSGYIKISRIDATCYDLVSMWRYAGGLSQACTVILELLEGKKINTDFWKSPYFSSSVLQKLGYTFDFLKLNKPASQVKSVLRNRSLRWTPLVKGKVTKGSERNEKWKIIVNETLEPDL